jgi:hypothetical protein
MEFDIKNISCVLCKIEWYEARRDSCEPYTMSKKFYSEIITGLERKIGAAKRLTALKACDEHMVMMRDLHDSQAKFNMERYLNVQRRINTLEAELQKMQYEFYSKGLAHMLTREAKERLQGSISHTRRSIGQYTRTLEKLDTLRMIKPGPAPEVADGPSTKKRYYQEQKKRMLGAKSGNYTPTAEDLNKSNWVMDDLGADCFSSGNSGNSDGKD